MGKPVKIIIWSSPRTCSTALLKCMSSLPNTKVFDELYSIAFLLGPDRLNQTSIEEETPYNEPTQDPIHTDKGYAFPSSICTYNWIKETLQQDYPDKEIIISKEIVYCLNHRYDSLPEGYHHVFLLRHPSKVFPSWKKLTYEVLTAIPEFPSQVPASLDEFVFDHQPPHLLPPGKSFQEGYELYQYVKENQLDSNPVIIDADDLVQNPAAIMSALCTKLGIPYSDSLLTWKKGTDVVETWTVGTTFKKIIQYAPSYENFRNSTGFHKTELTKQATTSPKESKITMDIERCVQFSMPFYQKMYEQRLQISNT
ncbi:branched-chain-amino-acid aminotransferase-like protein 2 [Acanthaster planci]|uniref:Branched-chain-amino-acid aminotransferase-like protein 2 n=1 Tax=Acanthaster planci TaxID=133434 RepID=A0A8B7Y1B6_ACAPL|nr:branched-chain-amino-acid aminotransferase-like protein 2 [Acanthaster planci]